MRGLRKPSTELENLAEGLGSAEDPYYLKPLADKSPPELAELVRTEIRYSALFMIRAGRIFMAIKKKLGHGEWEDFVHKQHWSWNYVRCSMKLLEVVAKFPQALHLPGGRTTERFLQLPSPEIESFLEDLPPEAVKKLTPWDLERIYEKKRGENIKAGRKPKPPKDFVEPDVTDLDKLFAQAYSTLNLISELKLSAKEAERAKKYHQQLYRAWDRASYNLRDPEHKTKPLWESHPLEEFAEENPA
ncbi:MAG: hypothetical protein A3G41_08840 [Elusimicrobia bacterium RIFCSPLOWO2_12_FULL_59_9]|nr:MAG: hypothetical protein A3G41_08840 [Elusimicrobia bacterium RIFCSPLOWO2_12_FULL_59_9]